MQHRQNQKTSNNADRTGLLPLYAQHFHRVILKHIQR